MKMNKLTLLATLTLNNILIATSPYHTYYSNEQMAEPLQGVSLYLNQNTPVNCPILNPNKTLSYVESTWDSGTPVAFNVKDHSLCQNELYPIRVHIIKSDKSLGKTCCLSHSVAYWMYQNFLNQSVPQQQARQQYQQVTPLTTTPVSSQLAPPSLGERMQYLKANLSRASTSLRQWNQNPQALTAQPQAQYAIHTPPPSQPHSMDYYTPTEYRYATPRLTELAERFSTQRWESFRNKSGKLERKLVGQKNRTQSDSHCFMHYKMQMKELNKKQCWSEELDNTLNANDAHRPLKNLGFRVIGREASIEEKKLGVQTGVTPHNAPYGSVIVWEQCPTELKTDPGHIETKLAIGFASDHINPINSRSGCSGYTIYFKEACVL